MRRRRTDIAVSLGVGAVPVVVIAGLLSLLLFIRIPGHGAWLRATLNASHAPIFAIVTILLAILLRSSGAARVRPLWPDWSRY